MAGAGEPIPYSLYVYAPNKGAAIFFTIAYAISTIFHIWQCYRYKAWKLVGLHCICGVMFTAGYAMREYGAYNYLYKTTTKLPLSIFITSQVCIYVCPPLLELANYHVLGRIFYYVPYCAPIAPGKVLATFGGLMGLVEFLNSLGVSLSANTSSTPEKQALGSHLTIAAISLQLIIIIIFVYLAYLFQRHCSKANVQATAVKTLLTTLYMSMALILVRCIYRLVEHTGNTKVDIDDVDSLMTLSLILRYEVFFYIFEAVLMLINSILWNIWHPGRFLPKDYHVYLSQDGTEVEGEEDSDNRPLLAKAGNVLTFGIFWRKKEQTQRFHQLGEYPGAQQQEGSRQYVPEESN
ncbi:Lipid-translocating exporter-like protein rta1 [Fusarium falciforme]